MAGFSRRTVAFCAALIGLTLASAAFAQVGPTFLLPNLPPDKKEKMDPKDAKSFDDIRPFIEKVQKDPSPNNIDEVKKRMPAVNEAAKKKGFDKGTRSQVCDLNNALGQYGDCKDLSNVTLQDDPNDRDALNTRAFANYGLKDYKAAKADARHVIQLDPSDERAFTTLALTHYAEGNYLQAVEDAKRALALDRNNETAFYIVKVAQGRIKPANLHLGSLDQARAEQIQREYEIASAQQNEAAASIKDAPAATATETTPSQALELSVSQKLAQRNYWGAIVDADRILADNPGDSRAHALRATAYNLVGRCEDGFRDATASLESPTADAYDARSLSEYCLGRYSDAASDATRALALKPDNAYAYLHRARALERMLNIQGALADYQKASELNPQFEPLYRQAVATYGQPESPVADSARAATIPPAGASSQKGYRGMPAWLWFSFAAGGLLVGLGIFGIGISLSRRERPFGPQLAFRGLQNYRLIQRLAEGGMGVVYEAFDEALNRTVAIKRMRDEMKLEGDSRERFLEEARTVAALRHPNITEIFSILDSEDDVFLVFEYISGRLMSDVLHEGAMKPAQIHKVFHGVCSALEYAHKHGVIHRDLKPGNIMITDEGESKVMDFGIAYHMQQAMAGEGTSPVIAGTIEYMAPEAREGVVRPESDVYALAVCLQEALHGKPLSPAATSLLLDAMEPNPDRRISSPLAFWKRLEALPELTTTPAASAAA